MMLGVMLISMVQFPGRNESVDHAEFLIASSTISFAASVHVPMAPNDRDVMAFLYSAFQKRVRSCQTSMTCSHNNNVWLLRHNHARFVKHRLLDQAWLLHHAWLLVQHRLLHRARLLIHHWLLVHHLLLQRLPMKNVRLRRHLTRLTHKWLLIAGVLHPRYKNNI